MPKQLNFSFGDVAQHKFQSFHEDNPHVYDALVRFALEAKRVGMKKLGMKALFERLRWWSTVETTSADYKLNNNYTAHYARLIMSQNKELCGFFDVRT